MWMHHGVRQVSQRSSNQVSRPGVTGNVRAISSRLLISVDLTLCLHLPVSPFKLLQHILIELLLCARHGEEQNQTRALASWS